MTKHFISLIFLLFTVSVFAEPKTSLSNGEYELILQVKEMPKDKKEVTLPAKLEIDQTNITIKTQGMMGNKIILKGTIEKSEIKFGMTSMERENIISFHYVGQIETLAKAKGDIFCFINGKQAFTGKWSLNPKK